MTGKRTRYSAEFKAHVALEALRDKLTTAQLATKRGLPPDDGGEMEAPGHGRHGGGLLGQDGSSGARRAGEPEVEDLHAKSGAPTATWTSV